MMRVPVHKGIGDHSAPAAILPDGASERLGPSDPTWHNTGTTAARNRAWQPWRKTEGPERPAGKARTGPVGGPSLRLVAGFGDRSGP